MCIRIAVSKREKKKEKEMDGSIVYILSAMCHPEACVTKPWYLEIV